MGEPRYTVYIRVPIPRGDFVDPPAVDWSSSKDEALWKILSGAAQQEIDWNEVAGQFDVPVDFLLQQVAYLTERHASQVRAQVRKATAAAKGSAVPSPTPTPAAETGSALQFPAGSVTSQGGRGSPLFRSGKESPGVYSGDQSSSVTVRIPTANTAVLPEPGGSSPRSASKSLPTRTATDPSVRRRLVSLPIESTASERTDAKLEGEDPQASSGSTESSSNESSDEESVPTQSRIIRRPPRFQQSQNADPAYTVGDEEDDESEPAFQPYKASADQPDNPDLAATLKDDVRGSSKRNLKHSGRNVINRSQTSDSSAGSPATAQRPGKTRLPPREGTLSPRRHLELTGQSPHAKRKGHSQEGSDGTPDMGSSYSDLDDASVTQSALEEALASHIGGGGSSRFSITQAFRSRHNAAPNTKGH